MEKLKNVKAIVFDAYGTLFNISSIDKRLEYHFDRSADLVATVWRRKQLEYTWLRSLMGRYIDFYALTEDALRFACKQHQVALQPAIVNDLMDHYYRLTVFPDVGPALQQLQEKYKLAILSNANANLLDQAVAYNKMNDRFSAIFSVDVIQQYKPLPAVYQLPVDGLGLPKEEIVFLSSNTWDVAGAKSFGLNVLWVQRKEGVIEELGVKPDGVVQDLREVLPKLG